MDLLQQVATDVAGRDIELPLFPIPIVRDHDFNTQFIRVHQAIERSTSMLEQQILTLDLLAQLILRYAENPPQLDKLGIEIQPVHRVRDYLEEHADREISLEQLSQLANLSPFHLNRWHSLPEVIVSQNLWNAATRISNSNANYPGETAT